MIEISSKNLIIDPVFLCIFYIWQIKIDFSSSVESRHTVQNSVMRSLINIPYFQMTQPYINSFSLLSVTLSNKNPSLLFSVSVEGIMSIKLKIKWIHHIYILFQWRLEEVRLSYQTLKKSFTTVFFQWGLEEFCLSYWISKKISCNYFICQWRLEGFCPSYQSFNKSLTSIFFFQWPLEEDQYHQDLVSCLQMIYLKDETMQRRKSPMDLFNLVKIAKIDLLGHSLFFSPKHCFPVMFLQ